MKLKNEAAANAKKKYCISGEFDFEYRTDDFRDALMFYKKNNNGWTPLYIERDGSRIVEFDGYDEVTTIRNFTEMEREIWKAVMGWW